MLLKKKIVVTDFTEERECGDKQTKLDHAPSTCQTLKSVVCDCWWDLLHSNSWHPGGVTIVPPDCDQYHQVKKTKLDAQWTDLSQEH